LNESKTAESETDAAVSLSRADAPNEPTTTKMDKRKQNKQEERERESAAGKQKGGRRERTAKRNTFTGVSILRLSVHPFLPSSGVCTSESNRRLVCSSFLL
jgi:hypothetical protein